ncbi:MAG TPA: MmcQ/YjbR family DNA-binding protein [Caulobacteraceae bacterium]|jgi:predicted DNA-binding protein (MmcQ/YjbR family)|nr:MmcQ/YjbR family DNA-binding protein [Caulobacteraceae bacterium]
MTPAAFETACMALPGASYSLQWGDSRVFKVGGKMFAIVGLNRGDGPPSYNFKASDMAFELLVEHGLARPAPYLARAKWVRLAGHDALSDDDLKAYLAQAHALVAARLTRVQKRALGLG